MVFATQPTQSNVYVRVVLFGDSSVGKTSTVQKYTANVEEAVQPTSQTYEVTKRFPIDGKFVHLTLVDTPGGKPFNPDDFKYADGAIVMYDVTNPKSFEAAKGWVSQVQATPEGPGACIVIAGNKVDAEVDRMIDIAVVEEYARSNSAKHYRVSSSGNINLDSLFRDTVRWTLQGRCLDTSPLYPEHVFPAVATPLAAQTQQRPWSSNADPCPSCPGCECPCCPECACCDCLGECCGECVEVCSGFDCPCS